MTARVRRLEYGCGCCGRSVSVGTDGRHPLWCRECRGHIIDGAEAPWDRTYEALHGHPCPFEEPLPEPTQEELDDEETFVEFLEGLQ